MLALMGLDIHHETRWDVLDRVVLSQFPLDAFARAMVAQRAVLRNHHKWIEHAKKIAREGVDNTLEMHCYLTGLELEVGRSSGQTMREAVAAVAILKRGFSTRSAIARTPSSLSTSTEVGSKRKRDCISHTPFDDRPERIVTLPLFYASVEEGMQVVRSDPRLLAATVDRLQTPGERVAKSYANQLTHLLRCPTFRSYTQPDYRIGWGATDGNFSGMKSIYRELRARLFRGYYSVDVVRCHTSMLVGAWKRANERGDAADHTLLSRMHSDILEVDRELQATQHQLPVDSPYRSEKVKRVLSAMINQDSSFRWDDWPLGLCVYNALVEAAEGAARHPLAFGKLPRCATMQTVALFFERVAVDCMLDVADRTDGVEANATINDEVLLKIGEGVCRNALREEMERVCGKKLGFRVRLCIVEVV